MRLFICSCTAVCLWYRAPGGLDCAVRWPRSAFRIAANCGRLQLWLTAASCSQLQLTVASCGKLRQVAASCGRLWQAVVWWPRSACRTAANCGRLQLWLTAASCSELWQASASCAASCGQLQPIVASCRKLRQAVWQAATNYS